MPIKATQLPYDTGVWISIPDRFPTDTSRGKRKAKEKREREMKFKLDLEAKKLVTHG